MFNKKKKPDKKLIENAKIASMNSFLIAESIGIDVRKPMIFPNNVKFIFSAINKKNIKIINNKYRDDFQFEMLAPVLGKEFNRGRKGFIYTDGETTMIVGEFEAYPYAPYKIYYKNDSCVYAMLYCEKPLEFFVSKNKKIVRYYNQYLEVIKFAEIYDEVVHEYTINKETGVFSYKEYPEDEI